MSLMLKPVSMEEAPKEKRYFWEREMEREIEEGKECEEAN